MLTSFCKSPTLRAVAPVVTLPKGGRTGRFIGPVSNLCQGDVRRALAPLCVDRHRETVLYKEKAMKTFMTAVVA